MLKEYIYRINIKQRLNSILQLKFTAVFYVALQLVH
jgi:hypothetical protein